MPAEGVSADGPQSWTSHPQKVLISGATGWLGSSIAREFLESGHGYRVTLLARETSMQVCNLLEYV